MVKKKWLLFMVYCVYMIVIVFPPLEPSLYNVFIDTIEVRVGPDIRQYILSYYTTKTPVNKQSQDYFLNSWYYRAISK